MLTSLDKLIQFHWQGKTWLSHFLLPLSWLFCALVTLRRRAYQQGLLKTRWFPVPVIVVGNISVGGAGKTPLVIWLVMLLKKAGYHPGVVSRGYGGQAKTWPQLVSADSDPRVVGDEAVMIVRRCDCPMAVGPNRVHAVQSLLMEHACDLVISDDGLQHYALGRTLEFVVIDGQRRFGNGRCLPAGPLRELPVRCEQADFLVTSGSGSPEQGEWEMKLRGDFLCNLQNKGQKVRLDTYAGKLVHAVAGIGHPQKFFDWLRAQDIKLIEHPFPDHFDYQGNELQFGDALPILMTEKDGVKMQRYATQNMWTVPVSLITNEALALQILTRVKEVSLTHG